MESSVGFNLDRIREMADEVSVREGCILYDVELVGQGSGRILRVFIDRQKPAAATIDDCANVSRSLGMMLDVEEVMSESAYDLEVSTPGMDRVLRLDWHFESAIGDNIQVNTNEPLPMPEGLSLKKSPKSVAGTLQSVTAESLSVLSGDVLWEVPKNIIHKAKVKPVFEHPGSNKPGGKNKKSKKKAKR